MGGNELVGAGAVRGRRAVSEEGGEEMSEPRERFCPYCGESMGILDYVEKYDSCGKQECAREARNQLEADREEAHREVDERMGF